MKFLNKAIDALLFLILGAMVLIVGANVFCRFLLNFSIYWGDELAQVLLVWITFIGAGVVMREKAHYAFDYLLNRTSGASYFFLSILSRILTITGIALLLYFSGSVSLSIANWTMPALGISRAAVYGACPAGCLIMLIYSTKDLLNFIKNPAQLKSEA